jgi:hypothetical protein
VVDSTRFLNVESITDTNWFGLVALGISAGLGFVLVFLHVSLFFV